MFSRYFNGCPMFNIEGFTFPVDVYYLEDVIERTKFEFPEKPNKTSSWAKQQELDFEHFIGPHVRKLKSDRDYSSHTIRQISKSESEEPCIELIQALLEYICRTDFDNGAILVFVDGWDMISKLCDQLQNCGRFPSGRYSIFPLHSMIPTAHQRKIFERPPPNVRKIIIATNIAETSITVDDIVFVVDTGKIKMTNFDVKNNIETLDSEWVSLANAKQREGRSGRVQNGICYHLYSKARLLELESFKKPEILRKRIDEVILQIKMLKLGHAHPFLNRLLESPSTKAIDLSLQRLNSLAALDDDENLTPLGFHLAQLPMDPQTGKMILMAAVFSCCDPVFSVAAALSYKDPFHIPMGKEAYVDEIRKQLSNNEKSDHMVNWHLSLHMLDLRGHKIIFGVIY